MLRLGLVCKFYKENIKFYTSTATYLLKLNKKERINKLSNLCLENSKSLILAVNYCIKNKIYCFRVNSQFLPLITHPSLKYKLEDLNTYEEIIKNLKMVKNITINNNFRLTMHPDQFVVLNSKNINVVNNSIDELTYQNELADLIGADVINIHAGGGYNDKKTSLLRFEAVYKDLSQNLKHKLTLENDDKIYSPSDLLDLCLKLNVAFVYDIHHHRCLKDNLSIEEASNLALKTWNREPLFHISSSKYPNDRTKYRDHSDYIDIKDFPDFWLNIKNLTVEVEAKAKEAAVKKFISDLNL